MKEAEHVIDVLRQAQKSLSVQDAPRLHELSNQTIHAASVFQDAGSITLAVLIYTLGKLVERHDTTRIKSWNAFVRNFITITDLAITALKERNFSQYENELEKARASLSSISVNVKPYIQEVLRKASINKASKIYEHGISMGQTAKLLGITQWELAEYAGQKPMGDHVPDPADIRKRAQMALEFFT